MRKLWPFLGIALAVALGIAVAPYTWWLLGLVVLWCVASVVYVLVIRGVAALWRRITGSPDSVR